VGDDILKQKIWNESLHQDNNASGVRIVNSATLKILFVKSTDFPHRNNHKCTWTSPDGKTHNHIDHTLMDRRWHSIILDVRSFRESDCDADHYVVVATVRERLAVNKQAAQKFDVEIFSLRKLSELEVRKQYRIEFTNRFTALENLKVSEDINRAKSVIKTWAG
jgi:hypothetical protein